MSTNYQDLCGWAGQDRALLKEANDSLPYNLKQPLRIYGATIPRRMMLFEIIKKLSGRYIDTGTQLIGDCVSWGGHKHPLEYLQLMQTALGNPQDFKYIYSPYGYGCGRVFVGNGSINGDGSIGAWQSQANIVYGSVPSDLEGLPSYSANVARNFGWYSSSLNPWIDQGKLHIVKSSAKVTTWDQLVDAIDNLYPVAICSDVGFTMNQQSDGFHHREGIWGHCMMIAGVDPEYKDPYACILNSWGDAHGEIKDFVTGESWPQGTLRVRKSDIEAILEQDDSFAYSGYNGFPSQELPDTFFSMI